VLVVLLTTYLVTVSPVGHVTRLKLYREVGDQVGFRHYTPMRDGRERLALATIVAGGAMDAAGLQKGDELAVGSVDELYYRIATSSGRRLRLPIVRNGTTREVDLLVPRLELSADPRKAFWFR
jgi:hypothetical protein